IRRDMGSEFNKENLLLFINEPQVMADYEIEYLGERLEPRNKNGYINKSDIEPTGDPFMVVARRDITFQGKLLYTRGDTFAIRPENMLYEIEMRKGDKVAATLFAGTQNNPQMGGFLASPGIKSY